MKIGYVGCSHSTRGYGTPWVDYMINDYDCETIDVTVSGTSNEFLIEKVKKTLEEHNDIDFFIFQLTDPMRLHLGLYGYDIEEEKKLFKIDISNSCINNHRQTNNIVGYNFLINSGRDINKILKTKYNEDFLNFIWDRVIISDFNLKIKIFHTLLTLKSLFEFYNKKVLFFSWNVDIVELAKENGYGDIIKKMNIIDGCVTNFCEENNLEKFKVDSTHYNSEAHKIIYNDFIKSNLDKFIKNI